MEYTDQPREGLDASDISSVSAIPKLNLQPRSEGPVMVPPPMSKATASGPMYDRGLGLSEVFAEQTLGQEDADVPVAPATRQDQSLPAARFVEEKYMMPAHVKEMLPPVAGSFSLAYTDVATPGMMRIDSADIAERRAEIEQSMRAPDTVIGAGVVESMVDAVKQSGDAVSGYYNALTGDYWVEYEIEDPESGTTFSGYEGYNDKGELKFGDSKLGFPSEDGGSKAVYLSSLRGNLALMSPAERGQVVAGANALLRHAGVDLDISDEPERVSPISIAPSLQPVDPRVAARLDQLRYEIRDGGEEALTQAQAMAGDGENGLLRVLRKRGWEDPDIVRELAAQPELVTPRKQDEEVSRRVAEVVDAQIGNLGNRLKGVVDRSAFNIDRQTVGITRGVAIEVLSYDDSELLAAAGFQDPSEHNKYERMLSSSRLGQREQALGFLRGTIAERLYRRRYVDKKIEEGKTREEIIGAEAYRSGRLFVASVITGATAANQSWERLRRLRARLSP